MLGSTPPPSPARQVGQPPALNPPLADKEGGGWKMGLLPPPPQPLEQFSSCPAPEPRGGTCGRETPLCLCVYRTCGGGGRNMQAPLAAPLGVGGCVCAWCPRPCGEAGKPEAEPTGGGQLSRSQKHAAKLPHVGMGMAEARRSTERDVHSWTACWCRWCCRLAGPPRSRRG